MIFHVNKLCIGCGLCASTCPEIFSMTDEGVAVAVEENLPDVQPQAREAQSNCPVNAIESH